MTVQYHSPSDILSIVVATAPYASAGAEDTRDPDVTLHYEEGGRLAEVEIEHASARLDLAEARRLPFFSELREELDVRAIRVGLGLSQKGFAQYLNVSLATVRNWEQGRRTPRGPARRLLQLSRDRPGMLFDRPRPVERS